MTPVVVIRPLSGYINRLQAIVSAQLLAEDIGADLWIDWQPSDVAPVSMDVILDPDFCNRHGRSSHEVRTSLGVDPAHLPDHLHEDTRAGVVTLAGRDRGEQAFMPALNGAWRSGRFEAIVVAAGGKFTLLGGEQLSGDQALRFQDRRREAYARLPLNPGIEERAAEALVGRAPFIAMHLRYSDRSLESPWSRHVASSLSHLRQATGIENLFIASDTPHARQRWTKRADAMGLRPWSTSPPDVPRSDPRSAWGALVDWRVLTRSSGMVFFAASSFAEEAAVASGHMNRSIGLAATSSRRIWMQGRQWARAAITYPSRHGWIGDGRG